MGKVKAMLKEYRVVISYIVVDEGFVEATSADEARELVLGGTYHPDWKQIDTQDWAIESVEEA